MRHYTSACATGNFCILNSVDHIRNGEADLMLAVRKAEEVQQLENTSA